MELTSITPDPEALKALSHPARLRMLGVLRSEGPATATSLAQRLGLNTGATSYHLRQLERHGFVTEDTSRGNARDRWWEAAHQATKAAPGEEPEQRDAVGAFVQAVAVVHTEQLQRAVEELDLLPDAWRRASTFSDWGIRLTPTKARKLVKAISEVIMAAEEDEDDPQAADFLVTLHAYPRPGTVVGES